MAAFTEALSDSVFEFRREGAFSDARCVGFGDAENIV